jgi:O-antigen/teichoic acid export membrane protein
MSESATLIRDEAKSLPTKVVDFRATLSRNIVASLARVGALTLVSLILPAYLAHHLTVTAYAAWVLILQLGAYVSYFDIGIQTAISKFVAEYEATNDHSRAGQHATAGFFLMILAGIFGVGLTLVLSWQVPRLFETMPASLYHDVRVSLIFVGSSLSFGLMCAAHAAIFLGLQRYWIPMTIAIVNRASFAAVVVAVVALRGNLIAMGIAVAIVNVGTGLLQVMAWSRQASHIRLSMAQLQYDAIKRVGRYCSLQSIPILAMLCITGLDITIVGHYDYSQTAYYSIATLPTTFMVAILASVLNPFMPASSALSTQRSPAEMGDLLTKFTRYAAAVLLLTGLPLIVCGLPILRIWVGPVYAVHTLAYLRVLVFANMIRYLCAPYATMICATDRQAPASASAIAEAFANLASSIYLARNFGAIGVALGTIIGSVVGVLLHFAVSMHFTQRTLAISRSRLFLKGMLRPALTAAPTLILSPFWLLPGHSDVGSRFIVIWGISTLLFAWFSGLNSKERKNLIHRSLEFVH